MVLAPIVLAAIIRANTVMQELIQLSAQIVKLQPLALGSITQQILEDSVIAWQVQNIIYIFYGGINIK